MSLKQGNKFDRNCCFCSLSEMAPRNVYQMYMNNLSSKTNVALPNTMVSDVVSFLLCLFPKHLYIYKSHVYTHIMAFLFLFLFLKLRVPVPKVIRPKLFPFPCDYGNLGLISEWRIEGVEMKTLRLWCPLGQGTLFT